MVCFAGVAGAVGNDVDDPDGANIQVWERVVLNVARLGATDGERWDAVCLDYTLGGDVSGVDAAGLVIFVVVFDDVVCVAGLSLGDDVASDGGLENPLDALFVDGK